MDASIIGLKIQSLRKKKRLSQCALADTLGVSAKTVSKWECGAGLPDVAMFPLLAEIFGVDIADLMDDAKDALKASLSPGDIIRYCMYGKYYVFGRVLKSDIENMESLSGRSSSALVEFYNIVTESENFKIEYLEKGYLINPVIIRADSGFDIVDTVNYSVEYFDSVTREYAFNDRERFVDLYGKPLDRIPHNTSSYAVLAIPYSLDWNIYQEIKKGRVEIEKNIMQDIINRKEHPERLYNSLDELIGCELLADTFDLLLDGDIIDDKTYKKCIDIFNQYINNLKRMAGNKDEILIAVKESVEKYNELNDKNDGFIDTDEREILAGLINRGAELAGLDGDTDYTEDWRSW